MAFRTLAWACDNLYPPHQQVFISKPCVRQAGHEAPPPTCHRQRVGPRAEAGYSPNRAGGCDHRNSRSRSGRRQADPEESPGRNGPTAGQRCPASTPMLPGLRQSAPRQGHHDVTVRTVFGNVELQSPRLAHCPCQPHEEKTFSPLQALLPEHVSPELLYLEVKWSSLLPYQVSCDLLQTCCRWMRSSAR